MDYNKIKLYGKTRNLKKGVRVICIVSYKCNLKCRYCNLRLPTGNQPQADEVTDKEWIEFFEKFPLKIREVYISGGETTLYPYLVLIVKYLLSKGIHVLVFSNLKRYEVFNEIPKDYRFSICATLHYGDDINRFNHAYNEIKKLHRIDVDEITYGPEGEFIRPKWLKYSHKKMQSDKEALMNDPGRGFIVNPSRVIRFTCWDTYLNDSL